MKLIKVGITIGDINGIGLEVILKTLAHPRIFETMIPVIYGSSKVVSYHKNVVNLKDIPTTNYRNAESLSNGKVNIINCWNENVNIQLGVPTEESGKYAYIAIDHAVNDLKKGYIDVLVTAPIHKQAMHMAQFPYKGHTDYLTKQFDAKSSLMMMVDADFRVAVVTDHVALKEVPALITKDLLRQKLQLLISTLQGDFGITKPSIAVMGLNPHASDGSIMGDEEENVINPVLMEMKKEGFLVSGPHPADGFFGSLRGKKYDAVLAMYHDQGLIPFKTMAFHNGVNYSAGLPIVRTSPDHGTGYDLVGKNQADASSFRNAVFLAIDIFKNRKVEKDLKKNAMSKKPKLSEVDESEN